MAAFWTWIETIAWPYLSERLVSIILVAATAVAIISLSAGDRVARQIVNAPTWWWWVTIIAMVILLVYAIWMFWPRAGTTHDLPSVPLTLGVVLVVLWALQCKLMAPETAVDLSQGISPFPGVVQVMSDRGTVQRLMADQVYAEVNAANEDGVSAILQQAGFGKRLILQVSDEMLVDGLNPEVYNQNSRINGRQFRVAASQLPRLAAIRRVDSALYQELQGLYSAPKGAEPAKWNPTTGLFDKLVGGESQPATEQTETAPAAEQQKSEAPEGTPTEATAPDTTTSAPAAGGTIVNGDVFNITGDYYAGSSPTDDTRSDGNDGSATGGNSESESSVDKPKGSAAASLKEGESQDPTVAKPDETAQSAKPELPDVPQGEDAMELPDMPSERWKSCLE